MAWGPGPVEGTMESKVGDYRLWQDQEDLKERTKEFGLFCRMVIFPLPGNSRGLLLLSDAVGGGL